MNRIRPSSLAARPLDWDAPVSRGILSLTPDSISGHWRTQFDFAVIGSEPVEMRLFLRKDDQILSETWLYQYAPAKAASSELASGT